MEDQKSTLLGCLDQIGKVYKSIAIVFLTTVIFLVGFEITVATYRGIRSVITPDVCEGYATCAENRPTLPYYQDQEWAEEFWALPRPTSRFHPYTLWRTETHNDGYRTFNEDGLRVTPNVKCGENAYHIYMFGGSTMWGQGSPDWGTIPAYLQKFFNETDQEVCIHNMGQRAFHSTQEVVELTNQLQLGVRPDMVVFFDGVNEINNTIETGGPWLPNVSFTEHLLWDDVPPFIKLISATHTYSFLSKYFESPGNSTATIRYTDQETDQIIQDIINTYLNNYRIVEALSKDFGFEFYFFWQPSITLDKPLTEIELATVDIYVPRIGPLYFEDNMDIINTVYREIEDRASDFDNLYYLGYIYEEHDELLFYDLLHVTPRGNEIVANAIFDIVFSES